MSLSKLREFGKLTAAVMAVVLPPMVHREELANAVGYIENAGPPATVVPHFVGQWLLDTTNSVYYRATAVTAGAWVREAGPSSPWLVQGAPAAKTTSTTLTAAELLGFLLTSNQGAAGAATYTLPLASDLETAFAAAKGALAVNDGFDFTVINISTNAAEDATIATNTGWTLVGNMVVESNEATAQKGPQGTFRVRRTAANAYTLYRVAG